MINKVFLTGNLTKDPELRRSANGLAVLDMRIAVNDNVKNSVTGEWDERPNYFAMTMFGSRAEGVSRFLKRGSKVSVEGKLRWSEWNDKDTGDKRSKVEVIVDNIEFMTRAEQYEPESAPISSVYDEEIPF